MENMNIQVLEANNVLTMSSLEIAELTGKQHKHVLTDIRNMLNSLNIDSAVFTAQYKDSTGRSLVMFNLPKDETLCLIAGYNVQVRMRIIKRWQELEEANKSNGIFMPNFSDPVEAAIAWANEKRLSRMLEQKIEEQKPKVEYVEKYVERNNTKNITATAKEIGISGRKLGEWLRKKDMLSSEQINWCGSNSSLMKGMV